jgi:endo-1,4-beta-xylanase
MVAFFTFAAAFLAGLPCALAAPSGLTTFINHETVAPPSHLESSQGGYYSFWSEGGGSFQCSQQGSGKYTCNWSGQKGGGFVAGTGFKPGGSR